jgi:very-short-patch-repair endonuclease
VFSGLTAAWLHGIDVDPCNPIEATVPDDAGVSARAGVSLRRSELEKTEIVHVRGMPATSIVRTVAEICVSLSLSEAVVIADAALHDRRLRLEHLRTWAARHSGHRGIRTLRRVIELTDSGAESPMESRLRMVLVLGGLPRPKAQVSIHDFWGRFVGRPDLYYEEQRLGIEYDGGVHRDSLAEDNRRQNKLLNAGVRLLRFTGADVLGKPDTVVAQVRAMLTNPGHQRVPAKT